MPKQTISLCMITKNEEKYLEQCLNSIKSLADEIIIVDTGSTDKTREIAAKFNAKIVDFKWADDFSAARNESLRHATKDWILVMDADETISKKDFDKLRQILEDKDCAAYYFTIRTYIDDSTAAGWVSAKDDSYEESKCAAGYFTTKLIRLFRNNQDIKFEGIIHETVKESINDASRIKEAAFPIHHFGRLNHDKLEFKKQLYQRLSETKAGQDQDFHSYSQLGIQAQEEGNFRKAIGFFRKSIELNSGYFKSWLNLGACYLNIGNLPEAKAALEKAISLSPEDYSAHNNLGIAYCRLNKPEIAIIEFKTALELNPKSANTFFNLGLAYDALSLKDKAYEAFEKAIELNPRYKNKVQLK
ncbi:tetratricopeptide repeat protein [Candidatus Woesearchaeota archaeon]|nr:tetratricopeptide repeat protein [Candidatus Woesearchaeota archaeon]